MIEGLEILSKEEITKLVRPAWTEHFFFITFGIVVVLFLFCLWLYHTTGMEGFLIAAFVCLVVGLITIPLINLKSVEEVGTGRYRYVALIHDTEALGKVYEQYEIVDCVGEFYILEDKE